MIPLADTLHSRTTPVVTRTLVAINVLVFLHELDLGRRLSWFFLHYGVVPIRYTQPEIAQHFSGFEQIYPFFTSLFLHEGWVHLISNMWVLWIFGDNVEERFGRLRFLVFYLVFGVVGGIAQVLTNADSSMPTIGASGAIAGVTGAYLVLFPHARVLTLVFIFIFIDFWEIPAPVFFLFWFFSQLFSGALSLLEERSLGGVAWWAHIGGFLVGMLVGAVARMQTALRRGKRRRERVALD